MNREELRTLGLTDEQIEKVLESHGKTIKAYKEKLVDYDEIKEENEKLKNTISELETAAEEYKGYKDQLTEKDNLIKEYELKNVKYRIAVETGIPLALADRLSGKSEEEIKKDAESLASFINQKSKLPLKTTETKLTDPKEQAYAKMLENL